MRRNLQRCSSEIRISLDLAKKISCSLSQVFRSRRACCSRCIALSIRRGQLHVVNRSLLEQAVCECYSLMCNDSTSTACGRRTYSGFSLSINSRLAPSPFCS